MSKINDLIKKLCPNGVPYKEIKELCFVTRGRVISKKELRENEGEYPVYSSQTLNNGVFGKINTYDFDGEYVQWTTDGANAGSIFYRNGKFSVTNVCGLLKVKDEYRTVLNTNFLNYILGSVSKNYVNYATSNPKLMSNVVEKIKVAIPPFEVQEEIVKILDKFGELEAELEAELESRKSQYEFWCDQLLTSEGVIYKLEDICNVSAGGTPSKNKREYWEEGTIKWLGSSVCENKKMVRSITDYITELGLIKSSAKLLKPGSTLIAMVGATIGKVAYLDFEACTNQNVACLYPKDENIIDKDYLFYLSTTLYKKFTDLANGRFAVASLGFIKSLEVKVPDLNKQKRIVSILDKFDRLVNDFSAGLPTEIEARRKQYEYYRNKLLSFEELSIDE